MGPREHREEERCDEGDVQQSFWGQVDHCWTDEYFRVCLGLDFQVVSLVVSVPGVLRCVPYNKLHPTTITL